MNSIMITKEISDQFYALETSLFLKEYLNDKEYLEKIFHPDYMEIGKNGNVYNRKETIDALYGSDDRNIKITGFEVRVMSLSMYRVNYVSTHEDGNRVYRTSIWMETLLGLVLYYHQGTIIKD